jgi:Tir chaperone protein (CesT) family
MSLAYRHLLAALAHEVGLDAEAFVQAEEIVIDDITVSLYFEGDEDLGEVVFFSLLGQPAPERAAEAAQVLLQANYLWLGTGGATLGLHPDSGQVLIAGRTPLEGLDGAALASLLDSFTDTASFWRRYLRGEIGSHAQAVRQGDPVNLAQRA